MDWSLLTYCKPTFFATTSSCDLPEINWFMTTNFGNQDLDYLENKKHRDIWGLVCREISQQQCSSEPHKSFSYTIKVGLQ